MITVIVYGRLPQYMINKLQHVHNCAEIVCLLKKTTTEVDHNVTTILKHLHWVPVHEIYYYKFATLRLIRLFRLISHHLISLAFFYRNLKSADYDYLKWIQKLYYQLEIILTATIVKAVCSTAGPLFGTSH